MLRRFLPVIIAIVVIATAAPATALIRPDIRCRSGSVSITFDDGPSRTNTPRLLRILRSQKAQATFFVTGQNATRYPAMLRTMIRDGHAVENHTWDHPDLTTRSNRSVRRQLWLTSRAIERATGRAPTLYRPPYGATDARVRKIAKRQGLHEVLWTIDTNDWRGGSSRAIAGAALKGLRKHRSNVILMHDAVGNSPRTLTAVPRIVRGLRARGFCLVPLERTMSLGVVSARPVTATERVGGSQLVPVTFRMDGPAQRDGSFRVRSTGGTAVSGVDFGPVDRVVRVRRGTRDVTIHVRVMGGDAAPGPDRSLTLRVDRPRRLRIATPRVPVTIRDDDGWSRNVALMMLSPTSV